MAGADETENQDVDTNRANAPPGRRQLHSFSPASHLEELRPRSRSRAREEAEALQANMPSTSRGIEETRIKEIKQLVEVELSQHVSPEALHQLKRHALDLSSKIETLQKVNARIAKNKADMESLGNGRIPNGTRPTPMPYESHFLDDLMPVRRDWSFTIPQGSSIRETKQILHCQYMWFMKEMDAQVADAQRQELRSFTKKSSFVERCQSLRSKQQSLWHSLDLDFEADDSEFTQCLRPDAFAAKIESVYISTIDRAATALQRKNALDAKAAKSKEDQIQQLLKSKPEDLLNAAIDDRIAKIGGKGNKQSTAKGGKSVKTTANRSMQFSPNMAGIVTNMFQNGMMSHDICEENLGTAKQAARTQKSRHSLGPKKSNSSGGKPHAKSKGKGCVSGKGKSKGKGKAPLQPGKGANNMSSTFKPPAVGFRVAKGKGKGGGRGKPPQKWKDKGKGKGNY